MVDIRLPRQLSVTAWDAAFSGPAIDPGLGWSEAERAKADLLHLDFTRVEWVDFNVLARALLLLDAAVGAGISVVVTLPANQLTPHELAAVDRGSDGAEPTSVERQMRHRAGKRGQANAFMHQSGFRKALEAAHWPVEMVQVRETGQEPTAAPNGEPPVNAAAADDEDKSSEPIDIRRRRLLPLQWFEPLQGRSLRESAPFLALETGLRDLGLAASDAGVISQTILAELIENVAQHADARSVSTPHALVGAMLLEPAGFAAQRENLLRRLDGLFDSVDTGAGRVLRLLVGDRGSTDWPATLRRPGNAASAIAAALTAAGDVAGHGDIRGLRRVARLVHSYRGCVAVRAGDLSASLLFGGGTDPVIAKTQDRAWMPGSLFEAAILTDQSPVAPLMRWQTRPAGQAEHHLRWVGCALDPVLGLSARDRASVEAGIARTRGQGNATGLVVTVSVGNEAPAITVAMQEALRHALEKLSQCARDGAVAAVFPNTSRHLLGLHVTELYTELERPGARGSSSPRPVLVFGSYGPPLWYGGSAELRAVLKALVEANGTMTVAAASSCWIAAGGRPAAFDAALSDERHLFTAVNGSLLLNLTPHLVISSLCDTAQQTLAGEVARGGAGTLEGYFRTPTLRVADRWIDVDRLLDGTIGTNVASFVLARMAEQELMSIPGNGSLVVAQAATCPVGLTTVLSECLALRGSFIAMASELDQDGWPATGEVPDNAHVVLCADLISTENTVRRAAAAIAAHADPTVIVCVVDTRTDRGPIKVLNREIPVVSLAQVDIGPAPLDVPESRITDIDPILHRPMPQLTTEPGPMDEDTLFDLCAPHSGAQSGALRLGHFERPRRVHFSANIDLEWLFRRDDARERIAEAAAAAATQALRELDDEHGSVSGDDTIAIWYPGAPRSNAHTLAEETWQRLAAAGLPVARPRAAERIATGTVWQTLPVVPDAAPAKRVLIIDFGTLTGTTTTQLVQHAARSGAERIAAVILLNQFPHHDTGMLGIVGAVRRNQDRSAEPGSAAIPTLVRFIIESSIGALDALDCPICATRRKYADLGRAPLRLRVHARRLRELLKPRSWGEIFQTASGDLFNVPVAPADAADYLRWRGLLQLALRQTAPRKTVLDLLTELAGQTAARDRFTKHGLIRLLAAEQHWLKLPPLRFEDCRARLAAICAGELEISAPEPPWLRAQAVMVLSIAAPQDFIAQLPDLLASIADEPIVVNQLLLDCYRLVRRPSHDSPVDHEELRNSLIRCRDYLEQSQSGWDHELIEDVLHVVRQLILLAEQSRQPQVAGVQSAWAAVREDWCRWVQRHHFEASVLRVRTFIEDLENAEPDPELAREAADDWATCAGQVQERALKFLPELREILAGQHIGELFGREDQARLVELTRTDTGGLFNASERLHRLIRTTRAVDSVDWVALRDDVLERINWWHRMFFAAHRPDSESPALLVALFRSAPTSIREVFDLNVGAPGHAGAVVFHGDLDVQVFCPRSLLRETVSHVFANAERHRITQEPQRFEVALSRHGVDEVRLAIVNSGTAAGTSPGKGLAELDRSLRSFGGSLAGTPRSGGEWSFETVVTLQLWRGA